LLVQPGLSGAGVVAREHKTIRKTFRALSEPRAWRQESQVTYMGHASITITLDRYGPFLPGSETHAANLLETWLTKAVS
jgi:hypothetical protein